MNKFLITFIVLALSLQCASKKELSQPETSNNSININDIWLLEGLTGFEHSLDSVNNIPTLEIRLSDSSYMGNSSCNSYRGTVLVNDYSISFKPALMTRMFCEGNYGLENSFLSTLEKSTRFEINGMKLSLFQKNTLLATFKKVD